MSKIYVRIAPRKQEARFQSFFRCGVEFGRQWKELEADAATIARLKAEQMLEVSEDVPADLEIDPSNAADPAGGSGPGAPTEPTDPAERQTIIQAALARIDKADESLWTKSGAPTVEAIAAMTGWPVSAAERDAAIAAAAAA